MKCKPEQKKPYDNFSSNVPVELCEKLANVAEAAIERYKDGFGWKEALTGDPRLDEISGVGYSGFIPFQDGGYEVSDLYRYDGDTTYHFTEEQAEKWREVTNHALECFFREDDELAELAQFEGLSKDDAAAARYAYLEEIGRVEEYWDYENEFTSDMAALLRFEIWVDRPEDKDSVFDIDGKGALKVFVCLSVGYSDSPYFRASHDDDTLYEQTFLAEDFLKMEVNELIAQVFEKV